MAARRICPSCRGELDEGPGDQLRCPSCRRRVRSWLVARGDEVVAAGRVLKRGVPAGVLITDRLRRGLEEASHGPVVFHRPHLAGPPRGGQPADDPDG